MDQQSALFKHPVRVYYEDTDTSGVVYHAQYLKFFERARTEWLRALGYSQQRLAEELALAFTVASANVTFLRPARLDDMLSVSVRLERRRAASLWLEQSIRREDTDLAHGRFRIGCIDAQRFVPRSIPANIFKELA